MGEVPKAPEPTPAPGRVRGRRRRALGRWTRRLIELSAALVAAAFVAFFSIDIGRFDSLRVRAEREASNYFSRPVHIERISALMWPGRYAVEGFVIEGRNPGDRPFLEADRIEVRVEWSGLLRGELNMEGRMTDWDMVIETWENNTHNLPKFPSATPPDSDAEVEAGADPPADTTDGGGWLDANVRFVYATRGHFTFINHDADWSVLAPNLSVDIARAAPVDQLVGNARFSDGTIQILDFLPMSADFTTRFTLDGSLVTLQEIDLRTDGADSTLHGYVDFANWPDQRYEIDSDVDFRRMRELFFTDATWEADGDGRFQGFFRMYDGGRELTGDFSSDEAHVASLALPNLEGSLTWLRDRFHVTDTSADFYGGRLDLAYGLEPLGQPGGATATFEADYESVDLGVLGDSFAWQTLQPEGRASGHVAMTWPNGRFREGVEGTGETRLAPRGPVVLAAATLPSTPHVDRRDPDFDGRRPLGRFPAGGRVGYTFDGDGLVFDDSWVATPTTHITFRGGTDGDAADFAFEATSYDWQESDRLLAAALTTYGSPTGAVDVGGRGTFNGRLSRSFSSPRVDGAFDAEALRAWDVVWGDVAGDIVVEDDAVTVVGGQVRSGAASMAVDGRFALGFHDDDTEEIDATFVVTDWPLADLRHAFNLDDWPIDGVVADAAISLEGKYRGPEGSGRMLIEPGVAWGEQFGSASGDFSFERTGLLISGITMTKGTGAVTGSAQIDWDGTYSFIADGRRIPVGSLDNFQVERTPLTGVMEFSTSGAGRFASPAYEFDLRVPDLFAADEFLGQLSAHLTVRDEVLTIDRFQTTSSRLNVSGGGSIALDDTSDAQLQFRFFESSLDPYLKFIAPELSPYTRALASGSLRVTGPLTDRSKLSAEATVDRATLTLLDYELRNRDTIRLAFENNAFRIDQFRLNGQDTALELTGGIDVGAERVDVEASGDASLAILQLFSTDLSTSGAATLSARILGPLDEPSIFGQATIADGRLRHRAFAHSLTNINGPIVFDTRGVSVDRLTGQLGEGDVDFDGTIALRGFDVQRFAVDATGRSMRLRYPEGLRSTVNADLQLRGTPDAPLLSGRVDILQANYQVEFAGNLLSLAGSGVGSAPTVVQARPSGFPLRFDIGVFSESLPIIEVPAATLWATADLRVTGTVDRPSLTGRVTIDQGDAFILGNQYEAQGGYIGFHNPNRIEPILDLQAETRVRAPGQTYRITIQVSGTLDNWVPVLSSDPAVGSQADILSLLLGEQPDLGSLEQRAIQTPQAAQEQFLRSGMVQLVASPISAAVGNVFQRVAPIDTIQVMPMVGNEIGQLNPTARITLGQRIGPRAHLTYSRAFNQGQFEFILLEIDQSDRLSWIISRNEDRTFALDFRIRYVF